MRATDVGPLRWIPLPMRTPFWKTDIKTMSSPYPDMPGSQTSPVNISRSRRSGCAPSLAPACRPDRHH